MEDNLAIKIYIIDVDGTLIPLSPLFKLIKKYKLDDIVFYPNRNYYKYEDKIIRKFFFIVGNLISSITSYLAYISINKKDRVYYESLFRFVFERLSENNNSLILIVSRSYTARFAFDNIIRQLQKKNRNLRYYTIFGNLKKEFLKRIVNYLENNSKIGLKIIIIEDNPKEVEDINSSDRIKKFLVDNPRETYEKLLLELYGR
ncbi:MAG: hypothetical protein QW197_01855 [Candidatus Aenigmatarchaeota archaeon]